MKKRCSEVALKTNLYKRGEKMNTAKKITLLQKLLQERYPVDIYDVSAKNSIFRLRAERVINKLYQLENGGK